jgi:hypothetical protein
MIGAGVAEARQLLSPTQTSIDENIGIKQGACSQRDHDLIGPPPDTSRLEHTGRPKERRMRWKPHVQFEGRTAETHQPKRGQSAALRPC